MADESLTFRAFGEDVSAGRMFGNLGDKADDAGDSIHNLGDESKDLDDRLDETREHLRALVADFEKTGDQTLFRDMRKDRSAITLLEGLRKELRGVGDEAEDAFGQAGDAAKTLDVRIEETRLHLRALIKDFQQTGNAKLFPDISSDRSRLSLLRQMKKELADLGDLGEGGGKGFLSGLPAGPVLIAAVVPIIAALVPPLGAMIGGAVLGAVGLGGIVGGVFAAAQDQRIKDAGGLLGERFMDGFGEAGRIFVNPILDQMGTLQHAGDVFLADFASGLASLAPLVKPLAQGLEGFAENLNLGEAFAAAEPAFRAFSQELPELGAALGDMFQSIGEESDGATMGLLSLLHGMEWFIRTGGDVIAFLSAWYEGTVRTGDAVTGFALKVADSFGYLSYIPVAGAAFDAYRSHLRDLNDETGTLIEGLDKAKDKGDDWRGSLAQQARAAKEAADETKAFDDAIKTLFGQLMGLEEAQVRYNEDLIATRKELKEGIKTLSMHTAEGLKNRGVLDGQVRDAERLREAHIANHMPIERANQLYEQQIRQLIALAVQLGFDRKEVERWGAALGNIPKTVAAEIKTPGLPPALQHAIDLNRYFDKLDGRKIVSSVVTEFREYRAGERNPSGRAGGGPVMAGTSYWVGENGPEIVTFGANGTVIPAGKSAAMAASGGAVDVNVSVQPSAHARDLMGQLILEMLRVDAGFRSTMASYVGAAA